MPKFLTPLRLEEISDENRGTWKLLTPLVYKSDLIKYAVVVPSEFVTDLASVPRIPVMFLLAGGTAHRAAVVHDWLYTSHEVSRSTADKIFREAIPVKWQAYLMWLGVRLGGKSSWDAAGPNQPEVVKSYLRSRQ